MLVKLGTLVRNLRFDETPSATTILGGLADALVYADKHPLARPLFQYFAPQWVLTDDAIVAPSRGYELAHNRPDRRIMDVHIKGKPWLDFGSYDAASLAAELFHPLTPTQQARG
jgi:hypothetical protein